MGTPQQALLLGPAPEMGGGRWPGGGRATLPQLVVPALPSEVSDSLLEDLIAAHLVLPNRVTVPVKKGLDVTNLRFPLPCVSTRTGHRAGPRVEGQTSWWGSVLPDGSPYFRPVRGWHPHFIGPRLSLGKVE